MVILSQVVTTSHPAIILTTLIAGLSRIPSRNGNEKTSMITINAAQIWENDASPGSHSAIRTEGNFSYVNNCATTITVTTAAQAMPISRVFLVFGNGAGVEETKKFIALVYAQRIS